MTSTSGSSASPDDGAAVAARSRARAPRRVADDQLDYDSELTFTYRGELFTGVCYEQMADGRYSELAYVDGVQHGWAREWSASGLLQSETEYRRGMPHGDERSYDEEGFLVRAATFEHGVTVRSETYDRSGAVVEAFEIGPDDPYFDLLQRRRAQA